MDPIPADARPPSPTPFVTLEVHRVGTALSADDAPGPHCPFCPEAGVGYDDHVDLPPAAA